MQKKLTITINEEVYNGLHKVIGCRRISQFIANLVRPVCREQRSGGQLSGDGDG